MHASTTDIRLTAFFQDNLGKLAPERQTILDFTEAKDSEWQWHQRGQKQICTTLQIDNDASTPSLNFLWAGCPSCCPTNSIKALMSRTSASYVG